MPLILFVLFVVVPLIELAVIIRVGQVIGAGWTILLLVFDSLVGAWLVQREGRRAWRQFRVAIADARWPGREVAEGALVLVGGALLLTPGFVTDVVGLLLVLPPTRRGIASFLEGRMVPMPIRTVGQRVFRGHGTGEEPTTDNDVLEVEVISIEREDPADTAEPGDEPADPTDPAAH